MVEKEVVARVAAQVAARAMAVKEAVLVAQAGLHAARSRRSRCRRRRKIQMRQSHHPDKRSCMRMRMCCRNRCAMQTVAMRSGDVRAPTRNGPHGSDAICSALYHVDEAQPSVPSPLTRLAPKTASGGQKAATERPRDIQLREDARNANVVLNLHVSSGEIKSASSGSPVRCEQKMPALVPLLYRGGMVQARRATTSRSFFQGVTARGSEAPTCQSRRGRLR